MTLKEKIMLKQKEALKSKNKVLLNTISMLRSDMKYLEIEQGGELDDDAIFKIVQSSIKKRKQSVEQYESGDRGELADKEREEIAYLEEFLPEQLSIEEVESRVKELASTNKIEKGCGDGSKVGVLIKVVMADIKGRADGKTISDAVKRYING